MKLTKIIGVLLIWLGFIGLFIGIVLTLIFTRRKDRKKSPEISSNNSTFDSLINEDRLKTLTWEMDVEPSKRQSRKPSGKKSNSTRKRTSKAKTKKRRTSR